MPFRVSNATRGARALTCAAAVAASLAAPLARAEEPPATPRLVLDSITVSARRLELGRTTVVPGREGLNRSLEQLGLSVVRRGVALASDLYADGFRRGDIQVVVDGERYHAACPNRMDPPTSLAIPIELDALTWDRRSSAPTAGLAGQVALHRAEPRRELRVRGALEGGLLRSADGSASIALEGRGQRLSGRLARGESYTDGGGSNFRDRYGYREAAPDYEQADLSWRGASGRWAWGAQGSITRDVPYAYLQMDERINDLWNASVSHGPHKLYVNRTRHRMDNGLRAPTPTMSSATDQVTAGALGRVADWQWDATVRLWNANNTIRTPMATLRTHMLPRYRQLSVVGARSFAAGGFGVDARLGLARASIGDASVLALHRTVHAAAAAERWFVPFTLGLRRVAWSGRTSAGWSAEVASEPPGAEQLWIAVRRPTMSGVKRPDWLGAPTLSAPVRGTLRGELRTPFADIDLGGSWVEGYVLPTAVRLGANPYQTYANRDVAMLTGRVSGRWSVTDASLAYTLGWDETGHSALAEIAPFEVVVTSRPRLASGLAGLVRVQSAAAQNRVDARLGEQRTPAWGRLDLGLEWRPNESVLASVEVVNVTAALFAQHLSYVRDPYASGLRVQEPGRTLRLVLTAGR